MVIGARVPPSELSTHLNGFAWLAGDDALGVDGVPDVIARTAHEVVVVAVLDGHYPVPASEVAMIVSPML